MLPDKLDGLQNALSLIHATANAEGVDGDVLQDAFGVYYEEAPQRNAQIFQQHPVHARYFLPVQPSPAQSQEPWSPLSYRMV